MQAGAGPLLVILTKNPELKCHLPHTEAWCHLQYTVCIASVTFSIVPFHVMHSAKIGEQLLCETVSLCVSVRIGLRCYFVLFFCLCFNDLSREVKLLQ